MTHLVRRVLGTAALGLTLAACGTQTETHGDPRSVVTVTAELAPAIAASDDLGWALYRASPSQENRVFSPLSIAAALAMTSLGAQGATLTEFSRLLSTPSDAAGYHRAFGELLNDLGGDHPSRGYELALANGLFGERTAVFSPTFIGRTAQDYGSPLEPIDVLGDLEGSRQLVNRWVGDRTRDRIPELLPEGALTRDSVLCLVNAITFQGRWASAFDPSKTHDRPFRTARGEEVLVPTLERRGEYRAARDELFSAVELDYATAEISMLVIVPNGDLASARPALDATRVRSLVGGLRKESGLLGLPRFEVHAELPLTTLLPELGLSAAFRPSADFSPMVAEDSPLADRLFIHSVLHQGYVRVDEQGTEASAATAVVVGTLSAEPSFIVASPFVFVIRDRLTGATLFIGEVLDPR